MPGEALADVASVDSHSDGLAHEKGSSSEESKQALMSAAAPPPLPLRSYASLRTLVGCALDGFEWLINFIASEPAYNFFLSGNFAPVSEPAGVSKGLQVTGQLPEYLSGAFVRVAPNPKWHPVAAYHWFDGDGMLHGVKFAKGSVSYVNRYVKTSRMQQEDTYGRPMFIKIGDMKGITGLLRILLSKAREYWGILDTTHGAGTANTALVYHGGSLLALQEADMPYAVRVLEDGELETRGRIDYGGALDHVVTAHPKVDAVTGEMYVFGYSVEKAPYVVYRVISPTGELGPKVPVTIPEPVMMHDFAITERHAILMDLPVVFDPQEMVRKGTLPFAWKQRPARFGVLPRNDRTEANIKWFTLPPLFIFHTANAWEDGEEVVMVACRFDRLDLTYVEANQETPGKLTEFRFNMATGEASEKTLSDIRCDFPRINDNLVGRKQRFVYVSVVDGTADLVGVAKFDLSRPAALLPAPLPPSSAAVAQASLELGGCAVGFFAYGPMRFGSEAVFVPRKGAPLAAEDDGCLLAMVFDGFKNLSEVVVIDAKLMSATPLAVVHLNVRVPYGFHGTFVTEDQLEEQK